MARTERQKKKHHFFRKLLVSALVVLVLFTAVCCVIGQPKADAPDTALLRQEGKCAILLAGTDEEGYRTDTIILVTIDDSEHTVSLLSIPRDTYTSGYSVPKINSACGAAGGGAGGMEELMDAVENLLGFRPDGYAMVNFDVFARVVDLFGGVDFDVPVDMDYEDPYQDLYIHLKAGEQHLNGEEALQVMRFRSGYAMADLERVNVQRNFVQAAMDQWLNWTVIFRAPIAGAAVLKEVTTDLSPGNCIWLLKALLLCDTDSIVTQTLPGTPQYINGGSYFVPDAYAVAQLMEEYYSPYCSIE